MLGNPGSGLTRLGLLLLAPPAREGPVVYLDVRGWLCPLAAWECGIAPERLVVVRCLDRRRWPQVAAAIFEGVRAVYAEIPAGVEGAALRRLAALARARRTSVVLRPLGGELPSGVAYLQVRAEAVSWGGPEAGHHRLQQRRLMLQLSGKGAGGLEQIVEVEDDGADLVRVVPRMVPTTAGRAAG
ncbi:MAG: hypothetical protein M3N51_06115 [Actinomycetota bacterium]|nr:hypothetical protein [Actinomycetota bacterium]